MKSKYDLSSKVIVVTGGAGLLGTAFAKEICLQGGISIIAEKDLEVANYASQKLESFGESFGIELDITSEKTIKKAITQLTEKFGRIDALINNAYPRNKDYGKKVDEVSYTSFSENISMNLGGYFVTSKVFANYFKKQGSGNIINIASIYGVTAPKFEIYEGTEMTMPVEYAVIKSGVIHLTKYLAKYYKNNSIRVNALSPGGIIDNQPSQFVSAYNTQCINKGMLDRNDLVGTLTFLLSDASTYINGQNLIIDDGFTL